jgi:hypothetical protein
MRLNWVQVSPHFSNSQDKKVSRLKYIPFLPLAHCRSNTVYTPSPPSFESRQKEIVLGNSNQPRQRLPT